MSLKLLHITYARLPAAGTFVAELPGLLRTLLDEGIESDWLAVQPDGLRFLMQLRHDPQETKWCECDGDRVVHCVDRADVVHIHGSELGALQDLFDLLQERGKRYVISPHGGLMPNPWQARGLWAWLKKRGRHPKRLYRGAAALHTVLPVEKDFLTENGWNRRVVCLPLGVSANGGFIPPEIDPRPRRDLMVPQDRRCVLFLGPLHPAEGLVPLLKAGEQIVHETPGWHLVLAGNRRKDWFEMIQAAIDRRHISDRVSFVLDPSSAEQRALLELSELVVQPSLVPTAPVSALEGLVCGKPCVVSTRCALGISPGERFGWQVEPRRSDLAAAMSQALKRTPDELQALGRSGAEWVRRRHLWSVLAPQYADFYRSLIAT